MEKKVKVLNRANGFVHNNKSGFSFIEMVIAIAIIALLGAIVVPNLMRRSPDYQRKQFVTKLNTLTQFAWQHAITSGKLHRMFFNIRKRQIIIEQATDEKDAKGEAIFKPLKNAYVRSEYVWPKQLHLQSMYIDGKDLLQMFDTAYEGWFYIVPSGLTQDVILNFEDRKDRLAGRPRQLGLVINPFNAQFKSYDTFAKP